MESTQQLSLVEIERIQNEKLRHMLSLCARGHKFYQKQWGEAEVNIAEIQTIDDLQRLPLTHKQELMEAPDNFRLKLPDQPLHERAIWEVLYTTGSTADPVPLYNTTYDYHAYLHQSRVVADISGIKESDIIANLFPLTHLIRAAREATLRGGDAGAVLLQGASIVMFLAVTLLAALAQYRSRLD